MPGSPLASVTPWSEEDASGIAQGVFFGTAYVTRFDGWKLSDDEAKAVGKPLAKVLDKYLPNQAGESPELSLAIVLLAMTGQRYRAWQEWKQKDRTPEAGLTPLNPKAKMERVT